MTRPPASPQQEARWSFRIFSLAGIDIRIHATLFLLVALFALGSLGTGTGNIVANLSWLGLIFACILVHEVAHSLMARRRGIGVRSITLLPIGGISSLERVPDAPRDEFAISIVGPLTSLAIAGVSALAAFTAGVKLVPVQLHDGAILHRLTWLNVLLGFFNLLPAFPMDGGRVLRALLARRMDRIAATALAAQIGRGFAVAMVVGGLFFNIWLAIIGVFIYFGASAEEVGTITHAKLEGLMVRDVMLLDPVVADPSWRAGDVQSFARRVAQDELPFASDGIYEGMVEVESVAGVAAHIPLAELVDRQPPSLSPDEPLEDALGQLGRSRRTALAVVANGEVVGLLRREDVRRAFARAPLHPAAAA